LFLPQGVVGIVQQWKDKRAVRNALSGAQAEEGIS